MRSRQQAGNALVEFALSFSLLWMAFSGVFGFAYSTYVYNALATRVADGARLASRMDIEQANPDTFRNAVKNAVVYGSTTPSRSATSIVPSLTTEHVSVGWASDAAGMPTTVTVAINGYAVNALFQRFELTNKPRTTLKYVGMYKTTP